MEKGREVREKMKLNKMVLANTVALWTGMLWVICSVGITVFPQLMGLMKWWLHLVDLSQIGAREVTVPGFVGGGISLVISAWLAGWLFGWCWEKMSKK